MRPPLPLLGRLALGLVFGSAALAGPAATLRDWVPPALAAAEEPIDPGAEGSPIEIEADRGIEWHRNEKVYIARGNATAERGTSKVYADILKARYRDRPGGGTEIWQIEAEGHVRLTSPGRTVYGDRAIYNLDERVLTMTGDNLRIVTTRETVTAEDSLEYHEGPQTIYANGNAVAVRDDKRVRADVLIGHLRRLDDGTYEIARLQAQGHVVVETKDTLARGEHGDYDLDKDFMTLTGDVRITNGDNQFNGDYAEMDVNSGVSRLLGSPSEGGRVKSLVMPSSTKSSE